MTNCPECGNPDLDRDEVDIGVGVQQGPASCSECGWSERRAQDADDDDLDDDDLDEDGDDPDDDEEDFDDVYEDEDDGEDIPGSDEDDEGDLTT